MSHRAEQDSWDLRNSSPQLKVPNSMSPIERDRTKLNPILRGAGTACSYPAHSFLPSLSHSDFPELSSSVCEKEAHAHFRLLCSKPLETRPYQSWFVGPAESMSKLQCLQAPLYPDWLCIRGGRAEHKGLMFCVTSNEFFPLIGLQDIFPCLCSSPQGK